MSGFPGGSAWAMVRDVAKGYLLVTERTMRRLSLSQLDQVGFEIERHLRDARGQQPDLTDVEALRRRNQRIQRLTGAQRLLQAVKRKKRS